MSRIEEKDWDSYWRDASKRRGLYASLAKLYRKFIISKTVRFYFGNVFKDNKDDIYLHAGCGSGDSDIRIDFKEAAFVLADKSLEALRLARQDQESKNRYFVCCDIFNLPFKKRIYSGIWNLGVMEHFNESAITAALKEFRRVLKDDGRFMIFWPPRYGLSVIALTTFLFITNKVFRRSIALYPDEVSRFSSRRWADNLFREAGLCIDKAHFSPRDLFTYVILTGKTLKQNEG